MSRKSTLLIMLVILTMLLAIPSTHSYPSAYSVPIDYPDLQTAVDSVPPGSTIYVDADLVINNPVSINGKSGLTIIFRSGSTLETSASYSSREMLIIVDSRDISILNHRPIYSVAAPLGIEYITIENSIGITVRSFQPIYTGPAPPQSVFGIGIYGGSDEIWIYDTVFTDFNSEGHVVGVYSDATTDGFDLTVDGFIMTDIYSRFSSVELFLDAFTRMNGWNLIFRDLYINNLYSAAASSFGIHVFLYDRIVNSRIEVSGLTALNMYGRAYAEPINIWSFRGLWQDSVFYMEDFSIDQIDSGFWGYSTIWLNIANFQGGTLEVRDGTIRNFPRAESGAPSFGVGINLGMPFTSTYLSRDSMQVIVEDITMENGIQGVGILGGGLGTEPSNNVDVQITNITTSQMERGVVIIQGYIQNYRFGIEELIHMDRDPSVGLYVFMVDVLTDVSPSTRPENIDELRDAEDLYIAYSIAWSVEASIDGPLPTYGVTAYETVVDELNSIFNPKATLRSIYTLETEVVSSVTGYPLSGAYVEYQYPSPLLYASGHTSPQGLYSEVMDYILPPSQVDTILIEAHQFDTSASTDIPSYITTRYGDPHPFNVYSLPSWYGRVVLMLPILSLKSLGFSHDTGTTMLILSGDRGSFMEYYSRDPTYIQHQPYKTYNFKVLNYRDAGVYVVVNVILDYQGEQHPTVIYIYKPARIVYSPGPIDFRGWY